jgi:DNA-binding NarL/FixJ family response regulator
MVESATSPIRIFIIERHTLVRAGLGALLEREPKLRVIGGCERATDACALIAREPPDVVLFEPYGEGDDDCELIAQLLEAAPQTHLILVTSQKNALAHCHAVQLGARGIVRKDEPVESLIKAIVKVHAGEAWLDRAMMADVITKLSRGQNVSTRDPVQERIASLSPREHEVIALLGSGLKNKQIADRLSLSEFTVRHHLTSIFTKLQIEDRLELIIFAYRHGLATLPK